MALPQSTASWSIKGHGGFQDLAYESAVEVQELGEYDCLIQIQAVSLNYRDLIITKGMYPLPTKIPCVPGSDASGLIIATGSKVTRFQRGSRVNTLFNQAHQYGPLTPSATATGLGGTLDGTLRQYAIFPETGLVMAPSKLDPLQSATLSCTYLTAWNALYGLRTLRAGQMVLTQGTGGVSIAAIQFAVAAGASVIATTSSTTKADKLKQLGVHHVLNYQSDPNWGESARRLTPGGQGVDYVIEIGGPNTMAQSLKAVKMEGIISVVGFLGGFQGEVPPSLFDTLTSACIVRGIMVGSRGQFEAMNQAIEAIGLKPVIDEKVFCFDNVKDAYQYVWDQRHFGKVVIKVSD